MNHSQVPETRTGPVLPSQSIGVWIAAGLFWFATVLCGGGTPIWAHGFLALVLGIVLLTTPPRNHMPRGMAIAMAALLLLSFGGLLPLPDVLASSWRKDLALQPAWTGPSSISPQPRITLASCALLLTGIAWLARLNDLRPDVAARGIALRLFTILTGILAAGVVAGTLLNTHYPLGLSAHSFSYFPNRNQTGMLLAMGGIPAFGFVLNAIGARRKMALAWLPMLVLIVAALLFSLSRATLLLFILGCGLYTVLAFAHRGERAWLKTGLPALAVLAVVVFAIGGPALDRTLALSEEFSSGDAPFRLQVYRDTLDLISDHPLTGVGLGNFKYVMPHYRAASANHYDLYHPESDWLWLGAELGIPGLLALALLSISAFRSLGAAWRSEPVEGNDTRRLCAITLLLFFLHSLVDVSGSRFGTVFAAGLLWALAKQETTKESAAPILVHAWRLAGVVLLLVGAAWLATGIGSKPWHNKTVQAAAESVATEAFAAGMLAPILGASDHAIQWAPLAWRPYFNRASAQIYEEQDYTAASNDFALARFLQPVRADLPTLEGIAWMHVDLGQTIAAWEAVSSLHAEYPGELYRTIIASAKPIPELHAALLELAGHNTLFLYEIALSRRHVEFEAAWEQILAASPKLDAFSDAQAARLVKLALENLSPETMAIALMDHPFLVNAYPAIAAAHHASTGDPKQACEVMLQTFSSLAENDFTRGMETEQLRNSFDLNRSNWLTGCGLLQAQMHAEDWDGAAQTIARLKQIPGTPPYLGYAHGQLLYRQGRYAESWETLRELK